VRRGRSLPTALSCAPVPRLFAQSDHPLDRALCLVLLRGGRRVSAGAPRTLEPIDWEQHALHSGQGKGRQDRRVYMSPAAVASVPQGRAQHPGARAHGDGFWHRTRHARPRSVKAIQKKMERYAKAAGITARGQSLRPTLASHLREHGAEVVAIRDVLGQSPISSSERYAKVSSQNITPASLQTRQTILRPGPV
jgi:site-specific recombinase XerD